MSAAQISAAYGNTNDKNDYYYKYDAGNGTALEFELDGGTITQITYTYIY